MKKQTPYVKGLPREGMVSPWRVGEPFRIRGATSDLHDLFGPPDSCWLEEEYYRLRQDLWQVHPRADDMIFFQVTAHKEMLARTSIVRVYPCELYYLVNDVTLSSLPGREDAEVFLDWLLETTHGVPLPPTKETAVSRLPERASIKHVYERLHDKHALEHPDLIRHD